MQRRTVSGIFLMLLLTSMLSTAFNIQPVKAADRTIYIRADGSIDPPDAPILTLDNTTYILTDNITSPAGMRGIVIERENTIIDGAGYTLQGPGTGVFPFAWGIWAKFQNNITVKNMKVTNFSIGIDFAFSKNCSITGNIFTSNGYGIYTAYTSNYVISGNIANKNSLGFGLDGLLNSIISENIVTNNGDGIFLYGGCYDNVISQNIVSGNRAGIRLSEASWNTVFDNDIINNEYGIEPIFSSVNNIIYHNNFVNNRIQVNIWLAPTANVWDDGYPSGGNYWSDYVDEDVHTGPNQDEVGSDGIWDHPYVIDADNQDNYPLVEPWEVVAATVEVFPDTLNTWSLFGKYITAYIELPESYGVNNIVISTVKLNGEIQAQLHPTKIGDFDNDGIPDLMVKFNRANVVRSILRSGESTLVITGMLIGKSFEGSYTVRVISG